MIEIAVQGFLLGLATGHICLVTCGPIYLPMLLIKGGSVKKGFKLLMQITAGRFFSYALFGLLAGFTGSLLPQSIRSILSGLSYIIITFLLIQTVVIKQKSSCSTSCGKSKNRFDNPYLMGAAMGLSLCPSFLLALVRSVDLSGPLAGLVLFSSFFVSTTIYLLPLSFIGEIGRSQLFHKLTRVAAAGVAVWCLVQAWPHMKNSYDILTVNSRTITIMSEEPLLVTGFMGADLSVVSKQMARYRSGPIKSVKLSREISGQLLICDGPLYEKHKDIIEQLKSQGCSIIVMDRNIEEEITDSSIDKMADFLVNTRFVKRKDRGFIYHLPLLAIKERA